jgi:hypothetical protein
MIEFKDQNNRYYPLPMHQEKAKKVFNKQEETPFGRRFIYPYFRVFTYLKELDKREIVPLCCNS